MKGSHSSPPSIQNTTCCATRNTSVLLVRNRPPQFGFLQKNLKTKHDKTASHRIIWSYMFLPVPKPNPSHSTGCPAEAPVPLSMVMALAASSADEKATPAVPLPRPLKHSTQVVLPASPQFRNPWRVAELKQTIIYELELCASVLALDYWAHRMQGGLQICFGDNDAARFSLIRGNCASFVATKLMEHHLRREAECNLCVWFARVPTEANVSDYPSRDETHPLLPGCCDESAEAKICFEDIRKRLQLDHAI